MKLYATLRKIRQFERLQLPFLKSITDFDIIIEIGYAQEQKRLLTPKQLFLLELGSATTVRRRLVKLIGQGLVRTRPNRRDRRSAVLTLAPSAHGLLTRYGRLFASLFTPSANP
jgi:DNA-binding MarR family transcriptional regulator